MVMDIPLPAGIRNRPSSFFSYAHLDWGVADGHCCFRQKWNALHLSQYACDAITLRL